MRFLTIFVVTSSLYFVFSAKSNVRALTESMGQEVIEMEGDLKDLPPDLDEEPSLDSNEDINIGKAPTIPPATTTKREVKKVTLNTLKTLPADVFATRKRGKDVDKIDKDLTALENEEEDRIEKEFADLYKDNNADYKMDSTEVKDKRNGTKQAPKAAVTAQKSNLRAGAQNTTDKPVLRAKTNFQFEPDSWNKKDVERFRTSIDEISCGRRVTKLTETLSSAATDVYAKNFIVFGLAYYTTFCM